MIPSGLSARMQVLVQDDDTAEALGSGDVPVLGTPRVVAAFEAATVEAITAHLDAAADQRRHPGRRRPSARRTRG